MADGTPFPAYLAKKGIASGIKLDESTVELPSFPGETITQGLDNIDKRCQEFYAKGCRFAKWRAAISFPNKGASMPSDVIMRDNAIALARYALSCVMNGLVPIVEPEVMVSECPDLAMAKDTTRRMLTMVFSALNEYRVPLELTVLKPNMVYNMNGDKNHVQVGIDTTDVLLEVVPGCIGGIFFLSGGQSEEDSTANLQTINAELERRGKKIWPLMVSYGRALQHSALRAWAGKEENRAASQAVYLKRCKLCALAAWGKFDPKMESQ